MPDQSPDKGREAPAEHKMIYSRWISGVLTDRNLRPRDVADLTGISEQTIRELIDGRRIIFESLTYWLAEALEVPVPAQVRRIVEGTRSYQSQAVQAAQAQLRFQRRDEAARRNYERRQAARSAAQPHEPELPLIEEAGETSPGGLAGEILDRLRLLVEQAQRSRQTTLDDVMVWLKGADLTPADTARIVEAAMTAPPSST